MLRPSTPIFRNINIQSLSDGDAAASGGVLYIKCVEMAYRRRYQSWRDRALAREGTGRVRQNRLARSVASK